MDEKNVSQEQHEKLAVRFILKLREKIEDSLKMGVIEESSRSGKNARLLDELIWCFFDDTRDECGLKHPSSLMTVAELLIFFDETLEVMSQYRPDLLSLDWQGKWQDLSDTAETDEY